MQKFMVNQSGYSEYVRSLSIEELIATAANLINAHGNSMLLINLLS